MIEELYGTKTFDFPPVKLDIPNFLYPGLQHSIRQRSISTGTVLQNIEELVWNGEFQNTFYITHTYQTATAQKVSLLEAQKMALDYLDEVEQKRQIEREREAQYWADLDDE